MSIMEGAKLIKKHIWGFVLLNLIVTCNFVLPIYQTYELHI